MSLHTSTLCSTNMEDYNILIRQIKLNQSSDEQAKIEFHCVCIKSLDTYLQISG